VFVSIQLQGDNFGWVLLFKQKFIRRIRTNFDEPPHTVRNNGQEEKHEDAAEEMMEAAALELCRRSTKPSILASGDAGTLVDVFPLVFQDLSYCPRADRFTALAG
jgi:hypothetical protein